MRGLRRLLRAVLLTVFLLALATGLALAVHTATVTNTDTSPPVSASSVETFTLGVTNNAGSTHAIKQVDLTVDADWTPSATQPAPPANWSVSVASKTITWTANTPGARIGAGSSLNFNWEATTGPAETSTHTWLTTDVPNATDTGQIATIVGAAPEFPLGAAPVLAGAALIYFLLRRRMRARTARE